MEVGGHPGHCVGWEAQGRLRADGPFTSQPRKGQIPNGCRREAPKAPPECCQPGQREQRLESKQRERGEMSWRGDSEREL